MNPQIKLIEDILKRNGNLSMDDKDSIIKTIAAWNALDEQLEQTIEAQKREIRIEESLEKVRVAALAMNEPADMTEICFIICEQLVSLDVKEIRNVQTAIFKEARGTYINYEFYRLHDKKLITEVDYKAHPMQTAFAEKMIKGPNEVFTNFLAGAELRAWYEHQKTTNQYVDTHLEIASSLNYYWYSLGPVALGISTYSPLPAEDRDLFLRFRNVFGLAYRRYLDIDKALAQAKEAQIELALEKVRARAMAMQKSNEVMEVALTIYEEVQKLDFKYGAVTIVIMDRDTGDMEHWVAGFDQIKFPESLQIPYFRHPCSDAELDAWKKGEKWLVYKLTGEEKKSYDEYFFEKTDYKNFPEIEKKKMQELDTAYFSLAFTKHGALHWATTLLSDEQANILQRFATVFEQSYTRFLDLQKAEAQARESQIEAALERVRSRTMAMQRSNELQDAANLLFLQVKALDIPVWTCGYNVYEKDEDVCTGWMSSEGLIQPPFKIPLKESPVFLHFLESRKKGERFYVEELSGEKLAAHYKYMLSLPDFVAIHDNFIKAGFSLPAYQINHVINFAYGNLIFITNTPVPESWDIFNRFATVFEQTYTRFLDLQKAEAQAKEARIELALERVRASTMAMHKSEDLPDTAAVLFKQLSELGDIPDRISIGIIDESAGKYNMWLTDQAGSQIYERYAGSINERTTIRKLHDAWRAGKKSVVVDLQGDELKEWLQYVRGIGLTVNDQHFNNRRVHNVAFFSHGWLNISALVPLPEETLHILERFAAVYSQTYRRFLDLQKAEAQAREARIEAALERVRSKAMSMQKSEDLAEAVAIVFEELDRLEMGAIRCGISIINKEKRTTEIWSTLRSGENTILKVSGDESMDIHPLLQGAYEAWLRQEDFSYHLKGEDLQVFYKAIATTNLRLPATDKGRANPENIEQFLYVFHFPAGGLYAFREMPFSEEAKLAIRRFAAVFNLTYTRFRDLQQAEAQAREAKIEAALERVRSKAMAMHNSEDLASIVGVSYRELSNLSSIPRRCGMALMNRETKMAELSTMNTTEGGESMQVIGELKMEGHPVLDGIFEHWLMQKEFHAVLRGNEIKEYYKVMRPQISYPDYPHDLVQFGYYFMFNEGDVYAWTEKELTEDELKMYRRFTSVLSLTYQRYKDIKLAEEQAREATIEAAMEKVRGRAMAMHNTQDLSSTAIMIFSELRKLGIHSIRFGVGLLVRESRNAKLYSATSSPEGENLALIGWIASSAHPVLEAVYQAWLKNEEYFTQLEGKELRQYYEQLSSGYSVPALPEVQSGQKQYGSFIPISVGCLYAWSEKSYSETELKIFRRFATIIDLTFRRYLELQKSEANALVAVRQASIDRVRAEIASMRKTRDLDRITPLIWNELVTLNVPFIRCGVFIMDDAQQLIHTFLSTPDGKAIAAFHLPYSTPGNIGQTLSHWREKTLYVDHWDEATYTAFADTLVKQGALNSREQYLSAMPKGGFYLHFLPFLQGMLYVANTNHLGEDDIKLIQSIADAFSTAYSRYEDFNRLELAKEQVEKTLTDLKQAQTQLVQSEKMASLGELTAGIAHEIQNPLNFVNNFSDVSTELLDEMKAEMKKGHPEGAMALADDVIVNLQKISHHGKRADAIVKGMLQHSRSSTGQKEDININQLADEYLRLAYHGLRAKDKSFNAVFKTDFDKRIGEIELMPQEFGRVLVNLISNAFYAVNDKKKQEIPGYEPTVTIKTKKLPGKIELRVIDNGSGIPAKLLDKIFQPFFTTKPTGQGTGLGLSLSYDIITKGHGGEMKVETKEGEGSEFVIWLPIQ